MPARPFNGRATHVLDASAIIALLLQEPGQEVVRAAGSEGVVSAVNINEVVAKMLDRGSTYQAVALALDELNYMTAFSDDAAARRAGALRDRTRGRNVSLADRTCLALTMETGLPVYTTDRAWASLDLGIDIRLIRSPSPVR